MDKCIDPIMCSGCRRNLRPPFLICDAMHILCSRCGVHLGGEGPLDCDLPGLNCDYLSSYYEDILDFCDYDCGYRGPLGEVLQHEAVCDKRPVQSRCFVKGCRWKGDIEEVLQHVDVKHPGSSIVLPIGPKRAVEICPGQPSNKLLVMFDKGFHMNCLYWLQVHARELLTVHCEGFTGRPEDADVVTFRTFSVTSPNEGLHLEVKGKVIEHGQYETDIAFIEKNCVPVNFFDGSFSVCFDDDTSYLEELECAICVRVMTPLIRQCEEGQSLCQECFSKTQTKSCSTCRSLVASSRNFGLEAIIENIVRPCRHRLLGCQQRGCGKPIQEHSKICSFQNVKCFKYDECHWEEPSHYYKAHIEAAHPHLVSVINDVVHTIDVKPKHTWISLLEAFDNLFLVQRNFDDGFAVSVEPITFRTTSGFWYSCELYNFSNGLHMKYANPCFPTHDLNSHEIILDPTKVTKIGKTQLDMFVNDNSLSMKITVYKNKCLV